MALVGFSLQPDHEFLGLSAPVLGDADYFEIAPETTWRRAPDGDWTPNGFHREFLRLGRELHRPFVGHAVHGSFGTANARRSGSDASPKTTRRSTSCGSPTTSAPRCSMGGR
jgi:hypothetical protein